MRQLEIPEAGRPEPPALGAAEVRIVGRGGAGVVTAGELLGQAAVLAGRCAQAIPTFGPERRGALCQCLVRLDDRPIRLRCSTGRPDVLLVLDPTIWHQVPVTAGLADDARLIFNGTAGADAVAADLRRGRYGPPLHVDHAHVFTLDGTGVALRLLGRPIANTVMLGAFAALTGLVERGALERVIAERFGAAGGANVEAARAGWWLATGG